MSDIKQKALALVNEVARELGWGETKEIFAAGYTRNEALFRAIEQHEAFRQEVSDAVEFVVDPNHPSNRELIKFIIPKPKPDPLVEIFDECFNQNVLEGETWSEAMARKTRAAMDARGLEIREKNDGHS